jgi:hypothetical protein
LYYIILNVIKYHDEDRGKMNKENKCKITKTSYDKIMKSIDSWPEWKKKLCNEELLVSVKSVKI